MAHEIDQQVEIIGGNEVCCGGVVEVGKLRKAWYQGTKLSSERILVGGGSQRIQANIETRSIVGGEQIQHQAAHDMPTKIRGEVAQPDHPIRRLAPQGQWGRASTILLLQAIVVRVYPANQLARDIAILQPRHRHRSEVGLIGTVRPIYGERPVLFLVSRVAEEARKHESRGHQLRRQRRTRLEAQKILQRFFQAAQKKQIGA